MQNIARALMRNGHDEHSAIAIAVAAVHHWEQGQPTGGMRGKPHSETRAAAARTHAEWEALRASHHKGDGGEMAENPWAGLVKTVDRYERDDLQYVVPQSGADAGADRPKPDHAMPEDEEGSRRRKKKKKLVPSQKILRDNPWARA